MSTVLLVIDMQNDYLYEKRKKNFSYNTRQLVSAVNEITKQYNNSNHDVIYIRHIIQNLPTNRLYSGIQLQEQKVPNCIADSILFQSTVLISCWVMHFPTKTQRIISTERVRYTSFVWSG